ncbi:hypothetical protein D3C79_834660 [compost metagenome]
MLFQPENTARNRTITTTTPAITLSCFAVFTVGLCSPQFGQTLTSLSTGWLHDVHSVAVIKSVLSSLSVEGRLYRLTVPMGATGCHLVNLWEPALPAIAATLASSPARPAPTGFNRRTYRA